MGDCRPHRPQDHRRHLRRHGAARRRRLLGQGPHQGRPLGRLCRALGGQERRGGRPGRPLPDSDRLHHRRGPPGLAQHRDLWHRQDVRSSDRRSSSTRYFDLRPGAIIRDLDLRRPIYQPTAAYGHFGRTDIDAPWETDRPRRRPAQRRRPLDERLGARGPVSDWPSRSISPWPSARRAAIADWRFASWHLPLTPSLLYSRQWRTIARTRSACAPSSPVWRALRGRTWPTSF